PGNRYCDACGMALPMAADAQEGEAPQDRLPGELEGERKQVTGMFCDIVRSMPLAERLGAEGMHRLLNEFFDLALGSVHRYEGTINQFLGDGFMALFGAPVAHEDHERRAILSALGILQALRLRQAQERDWAGRDLRIRIGMNSGPVVVGRIGNKRGDFTAVGDTTNLAGGLEQEAEPDPTLASEGGVRPIQAYLKVEPVGPLAIKGRDEPVVAYRIVELLSRRGRPQPGPPPLHAPVGRGH